MTGTSARSTSDFRTTGDLAGSRIVFVGGLHKSGTSALARCLAAHPEISGFRRTGVPEDEGQHLQSVYRTAREHGGPGRFAFDPAARLTEHSPLVSRRNRAQLLAEWGARWDRSRPILLEKSPPNLIRTRFLQALFPEAIFVLVVRHPLVVALATQRWVDHPVATLLSHWFQAHELLVIDLPFLRRALVVRYEEVVNDPSVTLRRIERLIGLDGLDGSAFEPGRNEEYLADWTPSPQAREDLLGRFEASANLFGYSLAQTGGPNGSS
jgi:Sulfotransferase family